MLPHVSNIQLNVIRLGRSRDGDTSPIRRTFLILWFWFFGSNSLYRTQRVRTSDELDTEHHISIKNGQPLNLALPG